MKNKKTKNKYKVFFTVSLEGDKARKCIETFLNRYGYQEHIHTGNGGIPNPESSKVFVERILKKVLVSPYIEQEAQKASSEVLKKMEKEI